MARTNVDNAADYAGRLGADPGSLFPALEGLQPHYGTHAIQQAADGLLSWLQGQALGPFSFGSLGGAASRELSEYSLVLL
jgi:hypothetical protein